MTAPGTFKLWILRLILNDNEKEILNDFYENTDKKGEMLIDLEKMKFKKKEIDDILQDWIKSGIIR